MSLQKPHVVTLELVVLVDYLAQFIGLKIVGGDKVVSDLIKLRGRLVDYPLYHIANIR